MGRTVRAFFIRRAPIAPLLLVCAAALVGGCSELRMDDHGAKHSLVEIGERSLEQGEALEARGNRADANIAYRKALWAFRYHQRLTGEEPFLMEEAVEGAKRTGPAGRPTR